jgi:hypothetical protein
MALSERSELGEIEANILHGIVPPIASPQLQIMNRRCRRYQRISQFNAVALTELSQIFPSLPCNLQVAFGQLQLFDPSANRRSFGIQAAGS